MAAEILLWLMARAWRSPWIGLSWILLVLSGWMLPELARYSIRQEALHRAVVWVELGYLWLLVGGWFALSACAGIAGLTRLAPSARRWCVRGLVFAFTMILPAFPFWVLGASVEPHTPLAVLVVLGSVLSVHLMLLALAVERLPCRRGHGAVFVALGGWLPAFLPDGPVGPAAWLQAFAGGAFQQGIVDESALWSGTFGTMIALALVALALDLSRNPAR